MRQIEKQMNSAIREGRDWKSGNTEVRVGTEFVEVFLHGNHIATIVKESGNARRVIPNSFTFARFPTATTRSRLRALGVNASVKNFHPCIDGVRI